MFQIKITEKFYIFNLLRVFCVFSDELCIESSELNELFLSKNKFS